MEIPTGRIWQCHSCAQINEYDKTGRYCAGCGKKFQPKIDNTNNDMVRDIIEATRMASKKTNESNLLHPL